MLRAILLGVPLTLATPALSATLASFDTAIGVTLQISPAEELFQSGGYLFGASSSVSSGDTTLSFSDDGNGDSCCSGGFVTTSAPVFMGDVALSGTGSVNSTGSVFAEDERPAVWTFGNFGASVEAVTISFDIQMAISQIVDPLVGGAATSGTEVTIQRDGLTIFNQSLLSVTDGAPQSSSFAELFVYSFLLDPTDSLSTMFSISVTGGVFASSNADEVLGAAPVPLPAGAALLLSGLAALGLGRRRRRSAMG